MNMLLINNYTNDVYNILALTQPGRVSVTRLSRVIPFPQPERSTTMSADELK